MTYVMSVKNWTLALALAGAGLMSEALAFGAAAQGRGDSNVPPGHMPRAGECRVWYDDRPPGRQPRSTDCVTAQREARRTGGRVIYAVDTRVSDRLHEAEDDRDRWSRVCDDSRRRARDCDWDDDRCIDRDRDGWCDWRERRPAACADRDRDGRCDYAEARYPSRLPHMMWAIRFERGRHERDVYRWLGTREVHVRYIDVNRDGVPEMVSWVDRRGHLIQRWVDDNRDGRADRVAIYRGGRVVRVIR
jgi:hypothetical protein